VVLVLRANLLGILYAVDSKMSEGTNNWDSIGAITKDEP